jgi:hypothetical protein
MRILKNKKVILGLCFYFGIFSMVTGCAMVKDFKLKTRIVKEDLQGKSAKGYVRFEFPSSKTSGEAAFDVGVNVAVAVFAGGKPSEDKLEVSADMDGKETPLFWIRTYDIENTAMYGPEYNMRWLAEAPGTYTYRVVFLKRMFEFPLCYVYDTRTVYGDVTVDVKENMMTPVTVYYMDFYDQRGNPKTAATVSDDASDTPDLDMDEEAVFDDERFHVGAPYPVSDETVEQFLDNKDE